MSGISTGVGLVSGINSTQIIEQLLALESRGKLPIQQRYSVLQTAKTALLDVNARLPTCATLHQIFDSAMSSPR
jgi:flagellar capping protein FliD